MNESHFTLKHENKDPNKYKPNRRIIPKGGATRDQAECIGTYHGALIKDSAKYHKRDYISHELKRRND